MESAPQLVLWQAEWCPASQRVRQRLTELGLDYLNRQVPIAREERRRLLAETGSDTIPALATPDGVIAGEEAILTYLARLPEPAGALSHHLKAEKARRRYLEEECQCPPPVPPTPLTPSAPGPATP